MALDTLRRQLATSDEDLTTLGVVPVPSPDEIPAAQEQALLAPFYRPVAESEMPPESLRRSFDEEERLPPFFRKETVPESLRRPSEAAVRPAVRAVAVTPPSAIPATKTPDAAPIPVKIAPPNKDVAAPVASALAPTTADMPAGKPDSAGKTGMPAPSSEGAGGDAENRLFQGQLLARMAAGLGNVAAGRSTDIGVADMLGERLKQVQALRAKREEQALEKAKASNFASRLPALFPGLTPEQQTALRETITAGGNVGDALTLIKQFKGAQTDKEVQQKVNEAALASAIARYPELAPSFEALRPVAGEYPQKDFAAMLDKAAGGKATFEAKGAATRFMVDKQGRFNQLTPVEVDKQKLQNDRLRQQIDLDAKQFKLKEDEALKQTYKDDNEKATKLNELAEKEKGFGGYVTLANDLAELEAAAPGFVTRGEAPEWLTSAQQAMGQNWPASTDPRVVKFLGAYGKLANAERHRLYGSAQTAGELKAFLQQLNDNPFSAGPDVLAMQMGGFAANVGRRATNTLNRYSNVFGSNVVDRVLGNEFRPLYDEKGVFSSFKTPFPSTVAPAAPSAAAPAAERVIMLAPDGKKKAVRADQVEKAKAQGWRMP